MQGMLHKKEGSHRIVCPRCGTENISRQSHCGKCGFIFPKTEKDISKAGGSSIPGAPRAGGGAMPGMGGAASNSSIPGAPKAVPVAPGGAVAATEGADAPKIKLAHEKIEAHAEGLIVDRGEWGKCPRCEGDVRLDAVRCPHCGWKMGRK